MCTCAFGACVVSCMAVCPGGLEGSPPDGCFCLVCLWLFVMSLGLLILSFSSVHPSDMRVEIVLWTKCCEQSYIRLNTRMPLFWGFGMQLYFFIFVVVDAWVLCFLTNCLTCSFYLFLMFKFSLDCTELEKSELHDDNILKDWVHKILQCKLVSLIFNYVYLESIT